ncbi:MAG: hypothetical protein AAFQ82_26210, partial [Myxococcota bacterium]
MKRWSTCFALALAIHALVLALFPVQKSAPRSPTKPIPVRWIERLPEPPVPAAPLPEPPLPEPPVAPTKPAPTVTAKPPKTQPPATPANEAAQAIEPQQPGTPAPDTVAEKAKDTPLQLFPDQAIEAGVGDPDLARLTPPDPRDRPAPYAPAAKQFAIRFKGAFRPPPKRVREFGQGLSPDLYSQLNGKASTELLNRPPPGFLPQNFVGGFCLGGCGVTHHRGHLEVVIELVHGRGRVQRVRVLRRSTLPDFDQEALEAVRYVAEFGATEAVDFGEAVETTRWKVSADVYRWRRDELLLDPGFIMPGE